MNKTGAEQREIDMSEQQNTFLKWQMIYIISKSSYTISSFSFKIWHQ